MASMTAYAGQFAGVPDMNWSEIGDPSQASKPNRPSDWSEEVQGYYFVDYNRGSSDQSYGTPDSPRRSIPNPISAGSYIEIRGEYSATHIGGGKLELNGTASNPIWIVGNQDETPIFRKGPEVTGSYFFIDGIKIEATSRDSSDEMSLVLLAPINNAVIRNSTITGNKSYGGITFGAWNGGSTTEVLIHNNVISDNGNWEIDSDQDRHGIALGGRTTNVWILENTFARNSGDGIQINGRITDTHHVYIAGNIAFQNKQTGFWVKGASDVIISSNTSYLHRASGSSAGDGMGGQYDHDYVWFINNHVYDCENGIRIASESDGGEFHRFIIGNVIHDIYNHGGPYTSAINLWSGAITYIVNNTIEDSLRGIATGLSYHYADLHIYNNIIGSVQSDQIDIYSSTLASRISSNNNIYYGDGTIIWGDGDNKTLSEIQSDYAVELQSMNSTDMKYVNATTDDYRILDSSVAKNTGYAHPVYDLFESRYGFALDRDLVGTYRVLGGAIDVGAYEYNSNIVPPSPPVLMTQ